MRHTRRPAVTRLAVARPAVALVAVALLVTACGGAADPAGEATTAPAADDATAAADDGASGAAASDGGASGAATTYPLTVENCGQEVVFDAAPERVVLLNSAPVVALDLLGVLDRGVARAGAFPADYFDDDTLAQLEAIPSLGGDEIDASGHFQLSQEVLLAEEPDLVLGLPDGISRDSLADAGIPVLVEPALCPEGIDDPTFDSVHDQVASYGEVFDRQAAAADAVADLEARVAAVAEEAATTPAADDGARRTAAVLYPTVGGGAGYAYGNRSMAHPQLEAAGFEDVFGDVDERVFEVTLEEVLDRDPDVLVLLYVDGDPAEVEAEIRNLPGADGLTAVRDDAILTQLFNYTEPPTPLSIDGLERIVATFGAGTGTATDADEDGGSAAGSGSGS